MQKDQPSRAPGAPDTRARADRRRTLAVCALVFAALSATLAVAAVRRREALLADLRARVESVAEPLALSLSSAIQRRFALVHGFRAFVESDLERAGQSPYLDAFARTVLASASGVRTVQVIRDGVIRYTYPLAGNEAALGLDLAHDARPRVREEFVRAQASRDLCLSGPFELAQGGLGFVARHAVHDGGALWGLVAIVLDVPSLLGEAGLAAAPADVDIALRDGRDLVFHGAPAVFDRAPSAFRVTLPDGAWTLAAAPRGGDWAGAVRGPVVSFWLVGGLIVVLATGLVGMALGRRAQRLRFTEEMARREADVWRKAMRVVGHEINNSMAPMISLLGTARALLDVPAKRPLLDRAFDTMAERAQHLRDFLDGYARLARPPAPIRGNVDWTPFLNQIRTLYAFRLAAPPPEQPGFFDPAQLQQVLINLLKNAHEAGGPADEVCLSVVCGRAGTRFVVADRGAGMDEAALRRAAEPFFTTKAGGSGLGLYLCREIVHAHGGRLEVRARRGGGTEVHVGLPPA